MPENSSNPVDVIENTFQLLDEGSKRNKLSKNKNVIFMLGKTGSGKSTLAQYIAGENDKLFVKEVDGDLIITDTINVSSSSISKTNFPQLIEDNGIAIYDCPGFADNRSVSREVASTYFIKSVIDHAESVKIILVVSYSALSVVNDRGEHFKELLVHFCSLIKYIKKIANSIALVATQVPYEHKYDNDGNSQEKTDTDVLVKIAAFLNKIKVELKECRPFNENPALLADSIELIDIFLTMKEGKYQRIGLFRVPKHAGLVSKNKSLQEAKKNILEVVHENISFIQKNDEDFGYTLSDASKNQIHHLVHKLNRLVSEKVQVISNEILNNLTFKVKQFKNIDEILKYFNGAKTYLELTDVTIKTPMDLFNYFLKLTKTLKMKVSNNNLIDLRNFENYLKLFTTISNEILSSKPLEWIKPLKKTLNEIKNLKIWYNFLDDLYNKLSSYEIQAHKEKYNLAIVPEGIKITQHNIHQFFENLKEISFSGYNDLKYSEIDEFKLLNLNEALDLTLNKKVVVDFTNDTAVIKGDLISLSELSATVYEKKVIKIFATDTIFIDQNIDAIGHEVQLSIIAPTWQIIGDRIINLSGQDAIEHDEKNAQDGKYPSGKGENGHPGNEGGRSGCFFGVGKVFLNGKHLTINANGGKGGSGQNGGNGADGKQGMHATPGTVGGNGGSGGVGGNGGTAGEVKIVTLRAQSNINVFNFMGQKGPHGKGGKGGNGGESQHARAKSGNPGNDGDSLDVQLTKEKLSMENLSCTVNEYEAYISTNLHNFFKSSVTESFLINLLTSEQIRNLQDINGLIHEIKTLKINHATIEKHILILSYESILSKIKDFTAKSQLDEAQKKAVDYVYMTALSNICNMRNDSENFLIINIKDYLKSAKKSIKQYTNLKTMAAIENHKKKYNETIHTKIVEANEFINDQILPEMYSITKYFELKTNDLTFEIRELQNNFKNEFCVLDQLRIELPKSTFEKYVSKFLNIMSKALECFGSLALIVSSKTNHSEIVEILKSSIFFFDKLGKTKSLKTKKEVDIAIEATTETLKRLMKIEEKVITSLTPIIDSIKKSINDLEKETKSQTQFAHDVSKWKIKTTLIDLKYQLKGFTESYEGAMSSYIEKIDEAMNTLITIYDRIHYCKDQKLLADYIADVHSPSSMNILVTDENLKKEINEMEITIYSNIILNEFENIRNAIKLSVFPFAELYLKDFSLPDSLSSKELVNEAVKQIEELESKIIKSENSLTKLDEVLFVGDFNSNNEYTEPFYVWKNKQFNQQITKLLSGEGVLLKADVSKGLKKDGVKFDEIRINFKACNEEIQQTIDATLKNYVLELTHLGNSYYRYQNQVYMISSPKQMVSHSFCQNDRDEPLFRNEVYTKIKNTRPILSPYAMWYIKLISINGKNFDDLKEFSDSCDLELVGRGQYVSDDYKSKISLADYYQLNVSFEDHST